MTDQREPTNVWGVLLRPLKTARELTETRDQLEETSGRLTTETIRRATLQNENSNLKTSIRSLERLYGNETMSRAMEHTREAMARYISDELAMWLKELTKQDGVAEMVIDQTLQDLRKNNENPRQIVRRRLIAEGYDMEFVDRIVKDIPTGLPTPQNTFFDNLCSIALYNLRDEPSRLSVTTEQVPMDRSHDVISHMEITIPSRRFACSHRYKISRSDLEHIETTQCRSPS